MAENQMINGTEATSTAERVSGRVDPLVRRDRERALRDALSVYRDAFNRAVAWVELDSLREGLYRNVEQADKWID